MKPLDIRLFSTFFCSDRIRTTVNVHGDSYGAAIVQRFTLKDGEDVSPNLVGTNHDHFASELHITAIFWASFHLPIFYHYKVSKDLFQHCHPHSPHQVHAENGEKSISNGAVTNGGKNDQVS